MKQKRHEIFSYPFEFAKKDTAFLKNYLKSLDNIGIRSALFKYFPYGLLYRHIRKDIDYVFYSMKYIDLARSLSSHKSIVIGSVRDMKSVEKEKNLFFFPIHYITYGVRKIYKTDPLLEKKSSEEIINFTVDFFKKIHPKFLVVQNDSLFVERFLVYCAKKAGIKTICIQDGIFQSLSNPIFLHGKYADLMYVWSQKQKNILLDGGIDHSRLKVLGYPHKISTSKSHISAYDKTKICVLGQPWELYDMKLGEKKKQIFDKLVVQFTGINIAYKPHPGEKDINYFPDNVDVFIGSLLEAIEEYDYFFSLTSTALLEVSLGKKIAIQIYDADFKCDIFEETGLSYTYDFLKNSNLRQYVDGINEPFPINGDALFVPENIGQRFLELEKEIQDSKG
ncbi:MAG: hypothetical protein IBX43_03090 [Campylobacterales bacterium]|nr:hypothetical protein [Campylobacterales bacterium]